MDRIEFKTSKKDELYEDSYFRYWLNNIFYNIAFEKESDEFEIHYKKGIKLGEKAKYYYSVDGDDHIVTIKNENDEYAATVLIKK